MQILKKILEAVFYPLVWLYRKEKASIEKREAAEALMSPEEYIQAWADRGW